MFITLTMLTSWLVVYLFYRIRLRPLGRFAPLASPELTQAYWDQALRMKRLNSIFVTFVNAFSVLLIYIDISQQVQDNWTTWRVSVPLLIIQILGIIIASLLASIPLDRRLRQTTWSWATHLRYIISFRIFWFAFGWGVLLAIELTRQVLPWYEDSPQLKLASFLLMVLLVWPMVLLTSYIGHQLLGLRPVKTANLVAMVGELSQTAGIKPPPIYLLPEWGGKIPLACVYNRVLIVSEYLVEQLDPAELRAIIAHELAHLARRDTRRRAMIAFASYVTGVLILHLVSDKLYYDLFDNVPILWIMLPLAGAFLLPVLALRFYRKQELRADKLGADLLGDPALMAQALEKIHRLACLPNRFLKEKKMTHPSLDQRMESLAASGSANESKD